MNRINYVKKLQKVLNENIGKKITVNFYTRFESNTLNETITGIIKKCFGTEDVIINTENGDEFINIYHIIGYSL